MCRYHDIISILKNMAFEMYHMAGIFHESKVFTNLSTHHHWQNLATKFFFPV